MERWSNLFFTQLNISVRQNYLSSLIGTFIHALNMFAPLVLLWVGAIEVLHGTLPPEIMLALNALAGEFLAPLSPKVAVHFPADNVNAWQLHALAHEPRILLLDEATSALDVVTEQRVEQNLKELTCTQIIIAHRLSTIRHADTILVLDEGRIIERGSHQELLAEKGYYASLIQDQLGS